MALGHDGRLYLLAFDHRGSFQKKMFGIHGEKVEHWLKQAASVNGFIGFAIGRSIWWDALKGYLGGNVERDAAVGQIAENYLRFVHVYERQEVH
jgi:myo-inositol catabolism protein IolC